MKIPVALAALSEGVIDRQTLIRVYGRTKFDMTSRDRQVEQTRNISRTWASARLGFDRVALTTRACSGLGEKAGLDIEGEQPGLLTLVEPKSGASG